MMRSTWKAGTLLVVAFALGAALGGAVAARGSHGPPWAGRSQDRTEGYLRLLDESLDLGGAQRDSVRMILERHRPAMDSIWQEVAPRYETLRAQIRSEIRGQLDSAQLRKYADLTARLDEERHKMTERSRD